MRTLLLFVTFVLLSCSGSEAPNVALGTYRGVMRGDGGPCPVQMAELTVTVLRHSAFGEWHFEQHDVPTRFACAWVNRTGVFGSNRNPEGRLEYVTGHFADDGTMIDAILDIASCSYTGKLSRIQFTPNAIKPCEM